MPLQVVKGDPAAAQMYWTGIGLKGCFRYDVDMGGFAVAHNTQTTALGTSGAGSCQIILVHKAPGHGALGHYAGDARPDRIVAGVQRMIQHLGGLPVAHVLFAAGMTGNQRQEQLNYEIGIVSRVKEICPRARITWPTTPQGDVWGCCYYLPLEERVGLRIDSVGGFTGSGDAASGITAFAY